MPRKLPPPPPIPKSNVKNWYDLPFVQSRKRDRPWVVAVTSDSTPDLVKDYVDAFPPATFDFLNDLSYEKMQAIDPSEPNLRKVIRFISYIAIFSDGTQQGFTHHKLEYI